MTRSLAFTKVRECLVYVSARVPPSLEDWETYLTFLRPELEPDELNRCVVLERSSGPNAEQRRRLQDATAAHKVRVAVIAESMFARGIVTALSWVKPGYKAFNPNQRIAALSYLDIVGGDATVVSETIDQLLKELDTPVPRASSS